MNKHMGNMKLHFIKASTQGNTTAFFDDDVSSKDYALIARYAMDSDYLAAEQVGFIVAPHEKNTLMRLEMAGGEFCGNATLALAALAVRRGDARTGDDIVLECSGAPEPMRAIVLEQKGASYHVRSSMPKGATIEQANFIVRGKTYTGGLIDMNGIVHLCIESDEGISAAEYDRLMDALIERTESDAYGIVCYRREGKGLYAIRPYICVPAEESRVYEKACGSGSLALSMWLHREGAGDAFDIAQPCGTIHVDIGDTDYITACVHFPCEGTMEIE